MFWFWKKSTPQPPLNVAGIELKGPLGFPYTQERGLPLGVIRRMHPAFLTLSPPASGDILSWTGVLQQLRREYVLGVNLRTDILRSFALVYDFADFIILDPDGDEGIASADLSDIHLLLDEVVNLRLCYERYTPVFLRLSHGVTPPEIASLCSSSMLSGLDGMVVPGIGKLRLALEEVKGHLPIVGQAESAEEALEALSSGAALVEAALGPLAFTKVLKALSKTNPSTL